MSFREFAFKKKVILEASKSSPVYDMIVVGGGPGGLTAAINGASERLKVAIIDTKGTLGGQARDSFAIENYPGFPKGATGKRLLDAFVHQAKKFNVEIIKSTAMDIQKVGNTVVVTTDDGAEWNAKTAVIASGLSYRRLPAIDDYVGRGVEYGVPHDAMTAHMRAGSGNVAVIGGANSAGQAALKLASMKGVHVHMLIRRSLDDTMSGYLVDRIKNNPNITVHQGTEAVGCEEKKKRLAALKLSNGETLPCNQAFVFIGASPRTYWAKGTIQMDKQGYILTGKDVTENDPDWNPDTFETSIPGIFAVGDVRSGSTKRIAAAVGEGAGALQQVHHYFARKERRDLSPLVHKLSGMIRKNMVGKDMGPCHFSWNKAADNSICGKRAKHG